MKRSKEPQKSKKYVPEQQLLKNSNSSDFQVHFVEVIEQMAEVWDKLRGVPQILGFRISDVSAEIMMTDCGVSLY